MVTSKMRVSFRSEMTFGVKLNRTQAMANAREDGYLQNGCSNLFLRIVLKNESDIVSWYWIIRRKMKASLN